MSASPQAPADAWAMVLSYVRNKVKPHQFDTWFSSLVCAEITQEDVVVATPNDFYKDWMEKHYRELIVQACAEVMGSSPRLRFTLDAKEAALAAADDPPSPEIPVPAVALDRPAGAVSTDFKLIPQYTFDDFVVGPSNRLAHAACMAVVESPARVYNPLFLHGDVGLGKTHLLQAICYASLQRVPDLRIVYLSCEEFVNQYIAALQSHAVEGFRARYRQVDLLLIDDIHFLSSKSALQEEFFHTFNALHTTQKQIILSSDAPPHEIPDLEARLVSRFKWGLVAEIEPPHYETKCAIIRKKALARGKELQDDVVDYLARTLDSNIRELEGAVLKVIVMAGLQNQDIDVLLCKSALKELTPKFGQVNIAEIMSHVANHFNMKVTDLQGRRRSKSIVLPRQICMYIGRKLTQLSLEELGGHFGGRDHTTVLYSESRITEMINEDPEMRALIDRFMRDLQRG